MTDITITGVQISSAIRAVTVQLGEAAVPFDIVYVLAGKHSLASAVTQAASKALYMVITGGVADDWVLAIPLGSGTLTLTGPTMVAGMEHVVSGITPGKIAPVADLTTGQFRTELFNAIDATNARLSLDVTNIAVA